MRSLYDVGARNSARLNAAPLRKTVIAIGGVNRTQGENFPQISGAGFYCEYADYPVSVSFVDFQTGEERTVQMRSGLFVHANFSGLTLTHPQLSGGASSPFQLVFYTFADGADIGNQFHAPYNGNGAAVSVVNSTALALDLNFEVPPGARFLHSLQLSIAGATLTAANWQLSGDNGSGVNAPCVSPAHTFYPSNVIMGGVCDVSQPVAGVYKVRIDNVPIPARGNVMTLNLVGTGFGGFGGVGRGIVSSWA